MKKVVYLVCSGMITVTLLLSWGCEKPPTGDLAVISDQVLPITGDGEIFRIDTADSWIRLSGEGADDKLYAGTLKLQYGTLKVQGETVKEGTFVIDITSLDRQNEGDVFRTDLRAQLMSGDLFDVTNFGTSRFELTQITPYKPADEDKSLVEGANYEVSGNLEVNNVTKNISFPARIELEGERMEARAKFVVDRRNWNTAYDDDKTLDDKFISESASIELYLEAMRENQAVELDPM